MEGVGGESERKGIKTYNNVERVCELGLRASALALTLGAAIVMGVDKQTEVVPIQLSPGIPSFNVPVSAKWQYLSAFLFFVVVNAIASVCAAVSLVVAVGNKGRRALPLVNIVDAATVALLFSANGATLAVGLIGYQGNSHVQWNKVCNVFHKFCDQAIAAVVLSLLGSLAFLFLLLLPPILTFHHTT